QKLEKTGIENATGWWNSLSAADFDNDGDLDYVAGNFGTNTFYQGNAEEPITIIAKDFDANGSVDPFISFYLRDSLGQKHNYPYHPWEDVVKQFRALRKSFNSYAAYGAATLEEVFENQELSDAIIKQSNWMESSWIENLGNQQFKLHKLPVEVQWAPVFATLPFDVDQDGFQDIILVGNDYGVEVHQGRSDALQGLVLKNNGKGGFIPLSMEDTHFVVPGDAKSLVLLNQGQQPLFIASQNNDVLKVYQSKNSTYRDALEWKGAEVKCIVSLPSGGKQLQLRQAQNSFQSQGSSSLWIPKAAIKVEFYDASGNLTRTLEDF
ncbi:MAG: VCBS repeat-containing protein, partial [Flavobacteriaceae bacterium]|nr:VCBS repeat-containing protein [Flavobacteriaceae bacterium]